MLFRSNITVDSARALTQLAAVAAATKRLQDAQGSVAVAQAPAVLNNVVLANIDARGTDIPKITAPAHGSFLISVDVPSKAEYVSYICSLYNASGEQLWQMPISAQQAENTVSLRVPTDKAANGANELRVLGLPAAGGSPVEVGRYRFVLQISQ